MIRVDVARKTWTRYTEEDPDGWRDHVVMLHSLENGRVELHLTRRGAERLAFRLYALMSGPPGQIGRDPDWTAAAYKAAGDRLSRASRGPSAYHGHAERGRIRKTRNSK